MSIFDKEKLQLGDSTPINEMREILAAADLAVPFWVEATATATLLASGGSVLVKAGEAGKQFKVRDVRLIGGGTSFASSGDRTIALTDGTTNFMITPNASIETAPAATQILGSTAVPLATNTIDTASVAGADIVLKFAGGTTDHSTTGSIKYHVCLQRVV